MPASTSKTPKRLYDVRLRFSEEYLYRVEAQSEDEAIEIADLLRMDPTVTPRRYEPYTPEVMEAVLVEEPDQS